MVSFAHKWPEELDALPLLPNLPTLTPTAHVLRHLRTVLFGATQNGEHLTTLVARPSEVAKTHSSSSAPDEDSAPQPTNLLIDGFAHNLSLNTLPIPVYAQLSEEQPILKYLPPGDTALTAFPIAAACRLERTDLQITFFTRTPDLHFYAFHEQSLNETDIKLSENSLSILLRTEPSNAHGLLEQRSSTTKSVQPVRMRDTTSIAQVAGAWYAGGNNEFIAAVTTLGRHLARRRNRRIALSSSPLAPIVAKAIILRFDRSVQIRWMYLMVRSTTTRWASVCQGSGAAGVPVSFQLSEQASNFSPMINHRNQREEKRFQTPRHTNSKRGTPVSRSLRKEAEYRSGIGGNTGRRNISSASRIRRSPVESYKEESFMTEKMKQFKFADEPMGETEAAPSKLDFPLSVRIRLRDGKEEDTDTSSEANVGIEATNTSLGSTVLGSNHDEDEATLTELCRKYLNVDFKEEVAREISAHLNK